MSRHAALTQILQKLDKKGRKQNHLLYGLLCFPTISAVFSSTVYCAYSLPLYSPTCRFVGSLTKHSTPMIRWTHPSESHSFGPKGVNLLTTGSSKIMNKLNRSPPAGGSLILITQFLFFCISVTNIFLLAKVALKPIQFKMW